jgi:hypothetical protein
VYIKRRSGQGAAVYEARCAELGLVPCTQVLQQLEQKRANMAHCKVGVVGAPALAAALAANSIISALDLRDNSLNGKVCCQRTAHAAQLPPRSALCCVCQAQHGSGSLSGFRLVAAALNMHSTARAAFCRQ